MVIAVVAMAFGARISCSATGVAFSSRGWTVALDAIRDSWQQDIGARFGSPGLGVTRDALERTMSCMVELRMRVPDAVHVRRLDGQATKSVGANKGAGR